MKELIEQVESALTGQTEDVSISRAIMLLREIKASMRHAAFVDEMCKSLLADSAQEPVGVVRYSEKQVKYIDFGGKPWQQVLNAGDKLYTTAQLDTQRHNDYIAGFNEGVARATPEGYQLVPIVPTSKMLDAPPNAWPADALITYKAMLAAAMEK